MADTSPFVHATGTQSGVFIYALDSGAWHSGVVLCYGAEMRLRLTRVMFMETPVGLGARMTCTQATSNGLHAKWYLHSSADAQNNWKVSCTLLGIHIYTKCTNALVTIPDEDSECVCPFHGTETVLYGGQMTLPAIVSFFARRTLHQRSTMTPNTAAATECAVRCKKTNA